MDKSPNLLRDISGKPMQRDFIYDKKMRDKEMIKRNFSKYVQYYDKYCSIQRLCALRLIDKVKTDSFKRILDIGCGTGNYTKLLRDKYPQAEIRAIDISREMVEIAKEKLQRQMIEFVVADGEALDFKEHFDLISSNACFQWFENLEVVLSSYKKILNKDGVISFSIFGSLTFNELNKSIKELFGEKILIISCNFKEKVGLEKILRVLFRKVEIDGEIYKERYASLSELLKKIRYTGIKGNSIGRKGLWTPKMIDELEKVYKEKFKEIIATYQVFFCKGVR